MSWVVVFRRAAEIDLESAIDWYESHKQGLGRELLFAVDKSVHAILQDPEKLEIVYKDVRRAFVRRFPYVLYYKLEDERIIILSVFHERRNPEIWMERN
jgi:toxin ParE1/3/4